MEIAEQKITIQIPVEYRPLFETWWREAAIYGGRNSLKSHTVARYLLIRARMASTRIFCGREFQNSIADSSHQLLADLINKYELADFRITDKAIINTITGSDFIFKGLRNNVQSVKSIEGIDIAWVEEAQTISEASLEILTPTVRKEGSQIIYTYNRLRDKDPIHQRLVIDGRPNTLIINVNYDVAMKYGWMSSSLIDEMEDDKARRPEIFKHKWLGEPSSLKGVIFPDWKKIPAIPAEARLLGPGIDFGYTNHPSAIVDVYKWNNAYILDEIGYGKGFKNREIANIIRKKRGLKPVQDIGKYEEATQELAVADSAEPKSIADLADCGINVIGSVKGADSINNGIQRLQELEIYYTEQSHNIEEEQLNYIWKINKEDVSLNVPIDAYNHAMDAARYKIMEVENFKPIEWGGVR